MSATETKEVHDVGEIVNYLTRRGPQATKDEQTRIKQETSKRYSYR